ncbi:hypothetical protein K469DRAFT_698059 [Zopfia rhizophila CBS 207.26]|uniref:Uncharacterized protein n=1 Tax=Zopfia rhizophila CBS 207.26 TaxID=1314779 RepID=A0A6A6ELR9_9PEZI|nr:hypothetical protein K469DRAFT_698059 [Zopfia rhizophila CBS 207.26]
MAELLGKARTALYNQVSPRRTPHSLLFVLSFFIPAPDLIFLQSSTFPTTPPPELICELPTDAYMSSPSPLTSYLFLFITPLRDSPRSGSRLTSQVHLHCTLPPSSLTLITQRHGTTSSVYEVESNSEKQKEIVKALDDMEAEAKAKDQKFDALKAEIQQLRSRVSELNGRNSKEVGRVMTLQIRTEFLGWELEFSEIGKMKLMKDVRGLRKNICRRWRGLRERRRRSCVFAMKTRIRDQGG